MTITNFFDFDMIQNSNAPDWSVMMSTVYDNMTLWNNLQQKNLEKWQIISQNAQTISKELIAQQVDIITTLMGEGAPEDKVAQATDTLQELYKQSHKHYRIIANQQHELSDDVANMMAKHIKSNFKELKSAI